VNSIMADKPRYYVFCETPDRLQDFLNELRYFEIKEAFVLPDREPMVCVIMEDPDEAARVKIERFKERTSEAASRALSATARALEEFSRRLSSTRQE